MTREGEGDLRFTGAGYKCHLELPIPISQAAQALGEPIPYPRAGVWLALSSCLAKLSKASTGQV